MELPDSSPDGQQAGLPVVVRVMGLVDDDPILASRRKGEQFRARFERAAGAASLVVLDFRGAESVTPSFFRGGPWCLWERPKVEQYPIVANLPDISLDDLEWVTREMRTPIWTGRLAGAQFTEPHLVGELDEGDDFALARIFAAGTTSAADLAEVSSRLTVTGWNNRLAGLWQRRVLRRAKSGRMYVYALPWKVNNG